KSQIADLLAGGDLIVNADEFTSRNLTKVGYAANPLEDDSLSAYQVHSIPLTSLTVKALEGLAISRKDAERAKNMFALGLLSWLYNRPTDTTLTFLKRKFANTPDLAKAN